MTPQRCCLLVALAIFAPAASAHPHPDDGYAGYEYEYDYDAHRADPDEPDFDREFSVGVGYARINFDEDGEELDAIHFNPTLSFAPIEGLRPLRLGFDVGLSFSVEDVGGVVSSGGGGLVVVGAGDTSLILIQPELTLGWRQPLGHEDVGLFIEPGVAGGGTFGYFDVDQDAFEDAGGDGDPDEWASTWHAKAYLRAGLRVQNGLAGIEAHYLRGGELDFDNQGDRELEHVYVGIFGALKF